MMDWIGYLAAALTTAAYAPQLICAWQNRHDMKAISLGMYILISGGIGCWLVYGVLKQDIPLIAANALTLVMAVFILFPKWRSR